MGELAGSWEEPEICTSMVDIFDGCYLLLANNTTLKCLVSAKLSLGYFLSLD